MSDKVIQELLTRLDAVAAKLGVGAAALWEMTLRQVVINGWCLVGVAGIAWLAVAVGVVLMVQAIKRDSEDMFLGGIFTAIPCFLVALPCTLYAISYLLNPQFAAFQKIMGMVR